MRSIIEYVKLKYPFVYNYLVSFVNKVILATRPYSIYVTDNLGGSFKSYFINNDMPLKINALKKDLDLESIELVQIIVQRLLYYPDAKNKRWTSKNNSVVGGLLPIETKTQKKLIERQIEIVAKSVKLSKQMIEESVFYFYHGLSLLPMEVHKYIAGQHFMDLGAYAGDSAIALSKYQYSKIFSLEISLKSIGQYYLNMKANGISEERYKVLNIGVASSDNELPVKMYDTGSTGLSLYRRTGKYDEILVEKKSLDWIVQQNAIEPKFIKVDIEGAAMDFVKGASETLPKFRPVLSIAIYHNPTEFFEVKPALEALLSNYTFLIRKLTSGVQNNLIHSEVVLLGFPNELISAK